jgi:hypothetical protein
MVRAGATTIPSVAVFVCGVVHESVAVTVKSNVPEAVGVPASAPVEAFNVIPAGSAPEVTLHVIGESPPLATSVAPV